MDQGKHACAIVNLTLVSVPLRGSAVADVDDDEVQTKTHCRRGCTDRLILDRDPQDRHSTRTCSFQYPRDTTRHDTTQYSQPEGRETGRRKKAGDETRKNYSARAHVVPTAKVTKPRCLKGL